MEVWQQGVQPTRRAHTPHAQSLRHSPLSPAAEWAGCVPDPFHVSSRSGKEQAQDAVVPFVASCHLPELQAHPVCAARLSASRRPCDSLLFASILAYSYGNDFDPSGQFTPGKVGAWHWDKRDWTVRTLRILCTPAWSIIIPTPLCGCFHWPLFLRNLCNLCAPVWLLVLPAVLLAAARPACCQRMRDARTAFAQCASGALLSVFMLCAAQALPPASTLSLQWKYPPRNFPMPPEGCTNEAVKTLIRCGRTH